MWAIAISLAGFVLAGLAKGAPTPDPAPDRPYEVLTISVPLLPRDQMPALARSVWGQPACGEPTIAYEHFQTDSEGYSVSPGPASVRAWGYVYGDDQPDGSFLPYDCTIHISDTVGDWYCEVFVHEWGHLTGHGHTATGWMGPGPPAQPECGGQTRDVPIYTKEKVERIGR